MDYQEEKTMINEVITHEREIAKKNYLQGMLCHANPNDEELDGCIECARDHEQLAEWLEELQKYKQIGTLEEVREAMEKQRAKKPCASNRCYVCPHCGLVASLKIKHNYCDACGQHIDWSEEE